MKRMALAASVAVSIGGVSVAENFPADYVEVEQDRERIQDVFLCWFADSALRAGRDDKRGGHASKI